MRRRYSRDLAGVDAVVWGIPFDAAVSNRPGARFGPQAIRRASAIFDGDPQYPFGFDPFETLAVVDYGDCPLRLWPADRDSGRDRGAGRRDPASGAQLFSLGGDHFVTYPLLKAHAAVHGPLALVQFDAHQDTWPDARRPHRPRHASSAAPSREGLIDPARSIQVGIRTQAPEDCGIAIIGGRRRRPARRRAASIEAITGAGRRGQGLSHLRHRLPRPGLRAGHRHAGRRRPVEPRGARRSCAASARSISSAATSSRWRRPTIMPISPRSPRRPWRCTISAFWPSGDEELTPLANSARSPLPFRSHSMSEQDQNRRPRRFRLHRRRPRPPRPPPSSMEITALTANSHAGKPMAEVFPHLGFVELPRAHHGRGGRLGARSTRSSAACRTARRRRSPRRCWSSTRRSSSSTCRPISGCAIPETYRTWYGHEHQAHRRCRPRRSTG